MINWRTGLAGFVGGSKHLLKGFFSYQYSVTTETPTPAAPVATTRSAVITGSGNTRTISGSGNIRSLSGSSKRRIL